ncbi:MAG: cysteine desulfurase [Clostridia bacterium]|nr:cysteine desulfurase [Clostridia bacterium]
MEKLFYLDNAATTKAFDENFDLIKKANDELFYNPSSSYNKSIKTKNELEKSREIINKLLHGKMGKLYFTSSATESNNTIFSGVHLRAGQTVLISKGEHPSVYNSAHNLSKKGINVIDIPLTETGEVDFEEYKKLLNDKTVSLISIIHSSNETGRINDIEKLCKYAKSVNPKIIFHSDGVQAFGKIKVNLMKLGIDIYTISAHKIYSVRGIGGLWIKDGIIVDPLLLGGGQENGFRSSTENIAGAIAFAYSAQKVYDDFDKNYEKVLSQKNEFLTKLTNSKVKEYLRVNSLNDNNPYVLSLSFDNIKGEVLMHALEGDGVLVSTGSACSSKKAGNRILEAMGIKNSFVIGSIRVSFSPYLDYDFDYIVSCFEKNVLRFEKNVNIKK